MKLIESKRFAYSVNNSYYNNTKYNNTFIFENVNMKLTFYFQPVIYGDDRKINGISIFRNTSSTAKTENKYYGKTYTPDYLIKAEYKNKSDYIILDAKFSTPKNIRFYQLQELVYKYLFSISALNDNDRILGLYILCGKKLGNDNHDTINDLAENIRHTVIPFAEIIVMNGINTENYAMTAEIINKLQKMSTIKRTDIDT